jgi:hypothetical protein
VVSRPFRGSCCLRRHPISEIGVTRNAGNNR